MECPEYQKNREKILEQLLKQLKTYPIGSSLSFGKLWADIFDWKKFPPTYPIQDDFKKYAEKNGFFFDYTKVYMLFLGPPWVYKFTLYQRKKKICFDHISIEEHGIKGQKRLLDINLKTYAVCLMLDDFQWNVPMQNHICSKKEWEKVSEFIKLSYFWQWDDKYACHINNEQNMWTMTLRRNGKIVKISEGFDKHPTFWERVHDLKVLCRRIIMRVDFVEKMPEKCTFCTNSKLEKYIGDNSDKYPPDMVCRNCDAKYYQKKREVKDIFREEMHFREFPSS